MLQKGKKLAIINCCITSATVGYNKITSLMVNYKLNNVNDDKNVWNTVDYSTGASYISLLIENISSRSIPYKAIKISKEIVENFFDVFQPLTVFC